MVAAYGDFRMGGILQAQQVGTMEPGNDFPDGIEVDDILAMNAQEDPGVKYINELG